MVTAPGRMLVSIMSIRGPFNMSHCRLKRMSLCVMLMVGLSACTGKDGTLDLTKPAYLDLTPPEGPPEYEQGWSDGCESGLNAYNHNFYKFLRFHDYKQDAHLRNNKMYYQAWQDAYVYCAIIAQNAAGNKI